MYIRAVTCVVGCTTAELTRVLTAGVVPTNAASLLCDASNTRAPQDSQVASARTWCQYSMSVWKCCSIHSLGSAHSASTAPWRSTSRSALPCADSSTARKYLTPKQTRAVSPLHSNPRYHGTPGVWCVAPRTSCMAYPRGLVNRCNSRCSRRTYCTCTDASPIKWLQGRSQRNKRSRCWHHCQAPSSKPAKWRLPRVRTVVQTLGKASRLQGPGLEGLPQAQHPPALVRVGGTRVPLVWEKRWPNGECCSAGCCHGRSVSPSCRSLSPIAATRTVLPHQLTSRLVAVSGSTLTPSLTVCPCFRKPRATRRGKPNAWSRTLPCCERT